MFKITKDLIAEPGEKSRVGEEYDAMPQYGMERVMGLDPTLPTADSKVKFRLRDEDGEVHYEGELDDDPGCDNQLAALRFGESDTGACIIEVLRVQSKMSGYSEWKIEVG